ncbi:MAG TPA: aminotransferase class III-fold pyridoxal phosphate-dependent enzyme [candidate division Zixibacteria bacterium]|nr:aminotransferase class III-fold pyridoxal phosphate-dependent enzyme [candidate division Zixibacteria bacterium]
MQPRGVLAIVQARMGSRRLPGKTLADIEGEPMLARVVARVGRARHVDGIVVATSSAPSDDAIADFCERRGLDLFRGSEADVLDRFYRAARARGADAIVRVTADCPLIDPEVMDRVIAAYLAGDCDYASNTILPTYPDGLDTEVFSFAALEAAWREARFPAEREHVTPYLRCSGRFRLRNVECEHGRELARQRWTVDEAGDLEFVRAIYARLGPGADFGWRDVLAAMDADPSLARVNGGVRNVGYYRSLAREPAMPAKARAIEKSLRLKRRAEALIPSCSQTFSKGPSQFVQGVAPVFLARGRGSRVWDVDGNEYIDYPMGLGPVVLGHDYPVVTEAVIRQLRGGTAFSLPHPLELEVAEILTELVPCAEMVRFGKNGSDVTAAAVRVARAYTGRDRVACCGYHGWQDWYIGTTTRRRGVPKAVQELTLTFEYNNPESLARCFSEYPGEIAAVIMEPVGVQEPASGFLHDVQALARRHGALLIFDEVVTGFRVALGGAQQRYGVIPDLACFGKAMANGFPLSAIVGRGDVMRLFDEVFFSFTFGGEAASLAAAKATIGELRQKNVIAHLWEQGRRLRDGYRVLAREYGMESSTDCLGLPPHTVVVFRDADGSESLAMKSLFMQECLKRGVLFSGVQNICFSHTPADIDATLRVYRAAMEILADAVERGNVRERLEGAMVEPVFRKP